MSLNLFSMNIGGGGSGSGSSGVPSSLTLSAGRGLFGGGDLTTGRTFSINDNTVTVSGSTSIAAGATALTYLTTTAGGTFALTLPLVGDVTQGYPIVFADTGGVNETAPLTLIPGLSNSIGGLYQNKIYYTNYGTLRLVGDGAFNWNLVGGSQKLTQQTFNASITFKAQAGVATMIVFGRGGSGGGGSGGGGGGGTTAAAAAGGGGGGGGAHCITRSKEITLVPEIGRAHV